jgi:hypothetical protein
MKLRVAQSVTKAARRQESDAEYYADDAAFSIKQRIKKPLYQSNFIGRQK